MDMDIAEVERLGSKAVSAVHIGASELPDEVENAIKEV